VCACLCVCVCVCGCVWLVAPGYPSMYIHVFIYVLPCEGFTGECACMYIFMCVGVCVCVCVWLARIVFWRFVCTFLTPGKEVKMIFGTI